MSRPHLSAAERDELTHNPANLPRVTVAMGGRLARLQFTQPPALNPPRGTRGPITDFTRKARKRLADHLSAIDRTAVRYLPLFITLTYPKEYPVTCAETKRHLDTFCKWLVRRYPHAAAVWRLEYQTRGAPHFHLLVYNVQYIHYAQIARHWAKAVGSGLAAHIAAGTQVQRIRSWRGVQAYVAKYICKAGEIPAEATPGRFWGIINRNLLPTRLLVRVVAWQTAYRLRRVLWRYAARHGYKARWRTGNVGCTIYISSATMLNLLNAT